MTVVGNLQWRLSVLFVDVVDNKFCLQIMDGQLALDTKHPYYFQVKTQMGVCKLESAYFVVWTEVLDAIYT